MGQASPDPDEIKVRQRAAVRSSPTAVTWLVAPLRPDAFFDQLVTIYQHRF